MSTTNHVRPPRSASALAEAKPCAAAGCPVLCSPGHVSCREHWRAIPQDLRDPLIQAFRRRSTDPIGFVVACDQARRLVQQYAHRIQLRSNA